MLLRLIATAVVIAGLRFGKDVVIPLTLAVLLSFLLTYPVTWLEQCKLGRVLSVGIVLIFALSIAGGIIWIGTQQLAEIVSQAPNYQANIQRKLQRVRNPAGPGLAKALDSIQQLGGQYQEPPARRKHLRHKTRKRRLRPFPWK